MTREERQLLLQDLCARLPYGVKMQVTLDLSYDTSYNSVEQDCDFVATLYAINIDGDPTDILIHHENDDTANYLNERFTDCPDILEGFTPYLRPMSSMTEEEKEIYKCICYEDIRQLTYVQEVHPSLKYKTSCYRSIDWLNKKMFDYRGLIEKGLALEAKEAMYN